MDFENYDWSYWFEDISDDLKLSIYRISEMMNSGSLDIILEWALLLFVRRYTYFFGDPIATTCKPDNDKLRLFEDYIYFECTGERLQDDADIVKTD